MADEEAPILPKAAAPAKSSSSWRLAVVVALVLGLVAGYAAGAAGKNQTTPLDLAGRVKETGSDGSYGPEMYSFGHEDHSFSADTHGKYQAPDNSFGGGADPRYSAGN